MKKKPGSGRPLSVDQQEHSCWEQQEQEQHWKIFSTKKMLLLPYSFWVNSPTLKQTKMSKYWIFHQTRSVRFLVNVSLQYFQNCCQFTVKDLNLFANILAAMLLLAWWVSLMVNFFIFVVPNFCWPIHSLHAARCHVCMNNPPWLLPVFTSASTSSLSELRS